MKTKFIIEHDLGHTYVVAAEGGMCADLGLSSPTTDEYARLIASAPYMYDALVMAEQLLYLIEERDHCIKPSATLTCIRSAIAKAEGK
jgi:hypothetical protein